MIKKAIKLALDEFKNQKAGLEEALAKQEQCAPVAWGWVDGNDLLGSLKHKRLPDYVTPLYTPEWYAQWIRNNYQNHPNIATLCDEMTKAAHGIKE